jgi:glycine hydroxymethyltransferase
MIFFNKQIKTIVKGEKVIREEYKDIKDRIDMAVFPALQGGPHNHQIGALAVQLKEVMTPEFNKYIGEVRATAKALGEELTKLGHVCVSGGTDTHLLLVDCKKGFGVNGGKVEKVCDLAGITLNKNCVPGDTSALTPSGIRIGTCAMATRGCTVDDMKMIAQFITRAVDICVAVQKEKGPKLVDFLPGLETNEEIIKLAADVSAWAEPFNYPGM